MHPHKKTYRIQIKNTVYSADEICLTSSAEDHNKFRIHGGLSFQEENLILPLMTKEEIVAWFRKAADLIEEAKFE